MSEAKTEPPDGKVKFAAKDIGKRPQPEYFTNIKTRKKSSLPTLIKSLNQSPFFKGWRKFALLALLLVAIAAPLAIIQLTRPPLPPEPVPAHIARQFATAVYDEAIAVSQSSSDTAFFDALAVFDQAIAVQTDALTKNELIIMKAYFLQINNGFDEALSLLLELKASLPPGDAQQSRLMLQLIMLYHTNWENKRTVSAPSTLRIVAPATGGTGIYLFGLTLNSNTSYNTATHNGTLSNGWTVGNKTHSCSIPRTYENCCNERTITVYKLEPTTGRPLRRARCDI